MLNKHLCQQGTPEDAARPSALAAAAAAQRRLRALVPRLRQLSSAVSASLGRRRCSGDFGSRQAAQLLRLFGLLQPYVADGAAALAPDQAHERPHELASVHLKEPCPECMLRELLRRLARCAAARSAEPLPSAPLYIAVETVYQAYADDVYQATGAPGKPAQRAWRTRECGPAGALHTECVTESVQGVAAFEAQASASACASLLAHGKCLLAMHGVCSAGQHTPRVHTECLATPPPASP